MRCRALVHVLIVGVLDLSPEDGLPSGDHLLGVDFLFLGGFVGLLDDRDLDLGFLGVELRLEAPSQLHGLLHAARVVVLHRAPVDVQDAGVELGVDDAILAEGRPLVLPELPGVELDDEVAVDLLHLSHAAVPSFLRVGVTVPGEGRPGSCPCACGESRAPRSASASRRASSPARGPLVRAGSSASWLASCRVSKRSPPSLVVSEVGREGQVRTAAAELNLRLCYAVAGISSPPGYRP